MQLQRMGQQRARERARGAAAVNKQPGKKCAWMGLGGRGLWRPVVGRGPAWASRGRGESRLAWPRAPLAPGAPRLPTVALRV